MPRTARAAAGGIVYHVLNRGNGRMEIFRKPGDYEAFLKILLDGKDRAQVELFGFCLMPNHWHLVVRPKSDHDLARFMSWVSNTHVKRYRAHYPQTSGHLYQGRYKSFPVEEDAYFLTLLRYVEANPLRAKRVKLAQDWQWSSLGGAPKVLSQLLDEWPLKRPRNWAAIVNQPLPEHDRTHVRTSLERGRPLGGESWTSKMVRQLGLQFTVTPRGRPRKATKAGEKK